MDGYGVVACEVVVLGVGEWHPPAGAVGVGEVDLPALLSMAATVPRGPLSMPSGSRSLRAWRAVRDQEVALAGLTVSEEETECSPPPTAASPTPTTSVRALTATSPEALPRVRFDTDYVQTRRVHNAWPFVAIDANRYSVPPEALGHEVEIRRPVNGDTVEVRLAGRLIATHRLVPGRRVDVWDPAHKQAAEALALGWDPNGPDLRVVADRPDEVAVERLDLGGDYDVASPDLDGRYAVVIDPEPGNDGVEVSA